MANRAGRLQKEAHILHARAQEQEALCREKKRRKSYNADALVKAVVSSRNMPRAMRRRSVQMGMLKHPMLLLTLAMYCERPNRLSALQNWQPPKSCNNRVLYSSFRHKVLTLAPLKDHQFERLQLLVQQDVNPSVCAWLVQTATDPAVVSQLPMPVAKLFSEMNVKLYASSLKFDLAGALRLTQTLLMGAQLDMAELIAWLMPALQSERETYYLQCIRFLIKHQQEINLQRRREILNFVLSPLNTIDANMRGIVEKQLGQPVLNFEVQEPARLLGEMDQLAEQIRIVQSNIMFLPFPKTHMPDQFRGTGVFENYQIHRLLHPEALVREGHQLNHCVGSYAEACYNKRCSIWSLTMRGKRVATIEVNGQQQIVQIKGKSNSRVGGGPQAFVLKWASAMALKYVSW